MPMMLTIPNRGRLPVTAAVLGIVGLANTPTFAESQVPVVGDTTEKTERNAHGVVFLDADGDGLRDVGERGLARVRVSNGRDVVMTDSVGRYKLPINADDDIVFVIKPRGYMTDLSEHNLPLFHYIHKPAGSPDADFLFAGVEPTGPLPESIDFPLYEQHEDDRFSVLLLGDPQPYDEQQVAYFARQVVGEIREEDGYGAVFTIALGDLVGDDLDLYESYIDAASMLGMPVYNVYGNHDMNFMATEDRFADETYERVFGPADYAFQHGSVHFIVLDNVQYRGFHGFRDDGFPNTGNYSGGLTDEQLTFVENVVGTVPQDERIVLVTHIPLYNPASETHSTPEHRRVLQIFSNHPHTFSVSAHTHRLWSELLTAGHGYTATFPDGTPAVHQHLNAGATCGSWWRGPLDERGLPLATMTDGTPSGYIIATFDGNDLSLRFRATREPESYQIRVNAPDVVPAAHVAELDVTVNAFMAVRGDNVELRVLATDGTPITDLVVLEHTEGEPDPAYVALYEMDQRHGLSPDGREFRKPNPCTHLFRLPAGTLSALRAGTYILEARYTDRFGQAHTGSRPMRVTAE